MVSRSKSSSWRQLFRNWGESIRHSRYALLAIVEYSVPRCRCLVTGALFCDILNLAPSAAFLHVHCSNGSCSNVLAGVYTVCVGDAGQSQREEVGE